MGGLFVVCFLAIVPALQDDCFFENKFRRFWDQYVDYVKVYTPDGGSSITNK